MGGGGVGSVGPGDISKLEQIAESELKKNQSARHVFISFDSVDINEVNLLRGQAKKQDSELSFDDHSVRVPFDSDRVEYIKQKIREKIDRASVTLVYLTEASAKSPWVKWEIEESLKRGKGIVGVYQGKNRPKSLPQAFNEGKGEVVEWSHEVLAKAIEKASIHR